MRSTSPCLVEHKFPSTFGTCFDNSFAFHISFCDVRFHDGGNHEHAAQGADL